MRISQLLATSFGFQASCSSFHWYLRHSYKEWTIEQNTLLKILSVLFSIESSLLIVT